MPTFGLEVQRSACSTCIFGPRSPVDLAAKLAEIADAYGGFNGYRVCHHSATAVCAGFWAKHRDDFAAGQIAQRLGLVVLVDHDTLPELTRRID